MKSILKKLCKAALALTLAFTGVLFTTKDARAAENETDIELYATPQSRTDTITVGGSYSLNVTLNLEFYIDATGLLSLSRASCTPTMSGQSCLVTKKRTEGTSQAGSNSVMYVYITYRSIESDGEIWEVQYRFTYSNNRLGERLKLSEKEL